MGVRAILKIIKTIKLFCLINNNKIDLYLYDTFYIKTIGKMSKNGF